MSNYSVTPKYPTSADVVALALFLAQRQSDSGTTNGGIAANGNPTVPLLAQGGPNDSLGLATAYFQAMADAQLCASGLQLESNNVLSSASMNATTYADIGITGTSVAFTAPMAKTYLVHCDFLLFFSGGSNPLANVRLVVNGSAGPDMVQQEAGSATFALHPIHLMHSAPCVAGANTIKLQWKVASGSTVNVNSSCYANFVISG